MTMEIFEIFPDVYDDDDSDLFGTDREIIADNTVMAGLSSFGDDKTGARHSSRIGQGAKQRKIPSPKYKSLAFNLIGLKIKQFIKNQIG